MWFWKIFMISFSLASIWLDRGGCAPYNYFDVGDFVANSDVRRSSLESGSRKALVGQDLETKSTNTIPTRGLYYPDDMFFTNWVPSVSTTEKCVKNQPSGKTSPCSVSKGTLKTKNNDKSTKNPTTLGQQKTTSAVKSSLRRLKTSTSGVSSSSSQEPTSTFAVSSSSRGKKTSAFSVSSLSTEKQNPTSYRQSSTSSVRKSTSDRKRSTIQVKTSSFAVPSLPRRQKTTTFVAPSLPRRRKPSKTAVTSSRRRQKTSTSNEQSTTSRERASSFVTPSLSRRRKTFTVSGLSSPIGQQKLTFEGRSMTSSQHNSDFAVESSTSRQQKYSGKTSSIYELNYTFDEESSSSGYRNPIRSSETTMADGILDLDYL